MAELLEHSKVGLEINMELLSVLFSEELFMTKLRTACADESKEGAQKMLQDHFDRFGISVEISNLSLKEGYNKTKLDFIKISDCGEEELDEGDEEPDELLDMLVLLEDDACLSRTPRVAVTSPT